MPTTQAKDQQIQNLIKTLKGTETVNVDFLFTILDSFNQRIIDLENQINEREFL